jgi:transposase-like protein
VTRIARQLGIGPESLRMWVQQAMKRIRTTFPAAVAARPADLVERIFTAPAPDRSGWPT